MSRIHSIPSDLLKTKMPFITDPDSEEDGINISEIELVEGDIALFSQPRDVIEAFYFGNQNTAQECKVIFLGEGKSGKSSLIERMINDTFESGKLPTEGIRMQTWPVEIDEETIRLRILDFGGQEIMHAMHRCFMTQHTVYVLVCEIRQDGDIDREAARWLENIDTFAKGCPVILALNKADENKNASVNEKNLKIVNPALRQTIKTSAAWEQKEGTTPLLEAIKDAVKDAMDKSEGNAGILSLRQDLENMEQNYITDKEYRTLCAKHGVDNRAVQSGLLNWFKDLGICYNFKSEALNTRLESFQVLNPAWLTNGIYRLILRTPENGMLSHATIKETLEATDPNDVLPDITYEPDETDFILHVMREFKISHIMSGGRELIPLKMTKTPPAAADDFDLKTALHLSWKANYLPNTVVHRLMICKFNELDLACLWRSGACFISLDKKQSAYVNMSDTCIDVYVQGIDKRMYMEAFRKEIISIMFDLDLKPEEMVHFFWEGEERALPYIDIVEQFRRGKTGVFVRGAEKEPNPRDILQEHYVNEKERVNMAGVNITINGDYNKVATDKARIEEQYVSNTKETHINTTTHTQEIIRDNILRRNEITQEDFETLVAHLKQISGHENTPPALAPKLNEIVEQCEDRTSKSTWYKLREFLGDAANIAALMSLTMAPEFSQMLSMIFR
ncbi:MAG: GTP-binding protein [Defluviitaleaceae bacterium]|nr:GTP-binding protein [Defluviitaleaceae bacterium]